MITYLHLKNFRRHEDTELHFDSADHLILISGKNGVGKTTIIEAIVYALYGESRHGHRYLDRMVRRSSELEGMEVELRFELDESEYRVVRRRDGRSSTAILYGNGEPLVESPKAVTSEISRILGMDAQGFKLAVVAQQKELDGLAGITPGVRRKMIGRLLRLDVVTKAKDLSRSRYKSLAELVRALGAPSNMPALELSEKSARDAVYNQKTALEDAELSHEALSEEILESKNIEDLWLDANTKYHTALGKVQSVKETLSQNKRQLQILGPPPAIFEAPAELEMIRQAQLVIERMVTESKEQKKQEKRSRAMQREHEKDVARLVKVKEKLSKLPIVEEITTQDLLAAEQSTLDARESVSALENSCGTLEGHLAQLKSRLLKAQQLGDVCAQCGQPISAQHLCDIEESLKKEINKAQKNLKRRTTEKQAAVTSLTSGDLYLSSIQKRITDQQTAQQALSTLKTEKKTLTRRINVYQDIQTPTIGPAYTQSLLEWQGALEGGAVLARKAETSVQEYAAYNKELKIRQESVNNAQEILIDCERSAAAVEPDLALKNQIEELDIKRTQLTSEAAMVSALQVELAVTQGNLQVAVNALTHAKEQEERRNVKQREAHIASLVSDVLGDLNNRLVREVQPVLQSTVSDILAQLSQNRFLQVAITEEYDILVKDDGDFQPIEELSGGERDLVALAVRLGLASLVSERHGSGGAGFLILDECFGSQDEDRRRSILDALRNLRGTYGQIFLISHVGGIEDSCDKILDVTLDESKTNAEVTEL